MTAGIMSGGILTGGIMPRGHYVRVGPLNNRVTDRCGGPWIHGSHSDNESATVKYMSAII